MEGQGKEVPAYLSAAAEVWITAQAIQQNAVRSVDRKAKTPSLARMRRNHKANCSTEVINAVKKPGAVPALVMQSPTSRAPASPRDRPGTHRSRSASRPPAGPKEMECRRSGQGTQHLFGAATRPIDHVGGGHTTQRRCLRHACGGSTMERQCFSHQGGGKLISLSAI